MLTLNPKNQLPANQLPSNPTSTLGSNFIGGGGADIAIGGANLLATALDNTESGGRKSAIGAGLSGAATGASMGKLLGPKGMAVGAVLGATVGAIGASRRNKRIEEANRKAVEEEQAALNMRNMQVATNTQAPMYQEGTPAAAISGPVEVERDEIVMRKNALGKYSVVADFVGGKTHNQGGELFDIREGDVVFPGDKRKKIKSLLQQNNHAGIEAERLKLPQDITPSGELAKGLDNSLNLDLSKGTTPLWLQDPAPVLTSPHAGSPVMVEHHTMRTPITESHPSPIPLKSSPATSRNKIDISEGVSEALRYVPAATNIIRGLQRPETVKRRFLTPETIQYRDMSEGVRQEIAVQAAIDAENASRFSGGSGQAARAGKSLAGSNRLRNLQNVNVHEASRAAQIEAQNIGIRNQARGVNLDLANKYEDMDAMNRAAIDAYFDQGVHDMGRIGRQISIDRRAETSQDVALGIMGTRDFTYDRQGNRIRFRRETTKPNR